MKKISYISQFWDKHPLESIGIGISLFCCGVATVFLIIISSFEVGAKTLEVEKINTDPGVVNNTETKSSELATIEISGSVVKPDIYTVRSGTRIKTAIELAGGLSNNADMAYVSRNFNLTLFVTDGQKIHIPSYLEINSGIFKENQRILEYLEPSTRASSQGTSTGTHNTSVSSTGISINSADVKALDSLPGVGIATAEKIMNGRPYQTVDDLVSKKVLPTSTFEKIKDQITL